MMLANTLPGRFSLWMVDNGIGMSTFKFVINGSSNITDMIPYPDIVLQSSTELNVTGKKKSKL